jgi:kynurenine formamidase
VAEPTFLQTGNFLMQVATGQLTRRQFEALLADVSNWDRWGATDQLGTLNLITQSKRKAAASLVKEGVSVSLSRNVIKVEADDSPPFEHRMVETGANGNISSSDIYSVRYHGFTVTHLDALCHVFYGGKMYNGFSQKEVTEDGAATLSVIEAKEGIFTRGILIDVARFSGQAYLPGGHAIYPDDLDRCEEESGIRVDAGDALFIRTGRWARRAKEGPWPILRGSAGLHASSVRWLRKRDIAILGSDLAADLMPSGVENVLLPVHAATIVGMGAPILDNCDLEQLSSVAHGFGRYEFLLTASPLAVEGGTGSPLNPVATF